MWSRIRANNLRISTKLTLVNAAILSIILLFTNIVTAVGIYFTVYHQAEVEMELSAERTVSVIATGDPERAARSAAGGGHHEENQHQRGMGRGGRNNNDAPAVVRETEEVRRPTFMTLLRQAGAILPGVVLRVLDDQGRLCFDGAPHFPAISEVEKNITSEMPFWSANDFQVATLGNLRMYYEKRTVHWDGRDYTLCFFRTITAERQFLSMLQNGLLLTSLLGLIIALLAEYFASRRALKPLRTITQTAQEIQVSDLSRRIPTSRVKDELSELIDTFNSMLDRLQAGFERERRFVSDASHELRTPVTVISGYADMLDRWGTKDPEALAEGVAAIRSEAGDMQRLIENLLFLARQDQKNYNLAKEPVDMAAFLADIAKKARLVAKERTVTLTANEPAIVEADPMLLREMLRVFLDNSIKYTAPGGHVELSSRRRGEKLLVTIKDDGIGIPAEHQAKVFDRFYRVDDARTRQETDNGRTGTGLGLSIASWIAQAHGMEISLASASGEGTTITVSMNLLPDGDNG